MRKLLPLLGLLGASACNPDATGTAIAAAGELGILELHITETGSELHVIGVGAQGATIGEVNLHTGSVRPEGYDHEVIGRELIATVGDTRFAHTSEGFPPLRLAVPGERPVDELLLDPAVATRLERWGVSIAIDDQHGGPAPVEGGYDAGCTASGCASPSWTLDCCEHGDTFGGVMESRICGVPGSNTVFMRHCVGGPSCPGGGTYPNCTGAPSCPSGTGLCQNNTRCCSSECGAVVGVLGCVVCSSYWSSTPFYLTTNPVCRWNTNDSCTGIGCGPGYHCDPWVAYPWPDCAVGCKGASALCYANSDCCSGTCNTDHQCVGGGSCYSGGSMCSSGSQCCTGVCTNGVCDYEI